MEHARCTWSRAGVINAQEATKLAITNSWLVSSKQGGLPHDREADGVGFVASRWLLSASRLLRTSAILPNVKKERKMNSSSLKNCIVTLEKLRDAFESQLEARVLVELDEVIADLKEKSRDDDRSDERLGAPGVRALALIEYIIKVVTNITELMKRF